MYSSGIATYRKNTCGLVTLAIHSGYACGKKTKFSILYVDLKSLGGLGQHTVLFAFLLPTSRNDDCGGTKTPH